jgi:hypothetical protein
MNYDLRIFKKVSEELIKKFSDLGFDLQLDDIDEYGDDSRAKGNAMRSASVPLPVPFPGMALELSGGLWLYRNHQHISLRLAPIVKTGTRSTSYVSSRPSLDVDHVGGTWGEFMWR